MLPGSRLKHYELIEEGGIQFYARKDVSLAKPSKFRRVVSGDRIDLIAYNEYGAPSYWWIIAELNGIFEVPSDMIVGDLIELLSFDAVIRKF